MAIIRSPSLALPWGENADQLYIVCFAIITITLRMV